MRRTLVTAFALGIMVPLAAQAQQWTTEQQEVWEFEMGCQEGRDAFLACFHDDYVAWADGSFSVPITHADQMALQRRWYNANEVVWFHMKPMAINVQGNLAVVLLVGTWTTRDKTTGEETTSTQRWSDVSVKENGRWYWLADHGGPVSSN